jgi:hypothetical protein
MQEIKQELSQASMSLIVELINDLPVEQRVCVFYAFHDKLNTTQIAEQLAVSEDEVQSRLTAAQSTIQAALDSREDDTEPKLPKAVALPLVLAPAIKYGVDSGTLNVSGLSAAPAMSATPATAVNTAATTSAVPVKAIMAACVAGVVVIGGILAAVFLLGGDDDVAPVGREGGVNREAGDEEDNGGNEVEETTERGGHVNFSDREITDEQLAEMVESGEIPSNASSLWLSGNEITDISPLTSLTGLAVLNLMGNPISDISPLSSIASLTEVAFDYPVIDITPLTSLPNLTSLYWGFPLTYGTYDGTVDISVLSQLTNLTELVLNSLPISDISPLGSLTNLTALTLNAWAVNDITPLGSMTNLRQLTINSFIRDISVLSSLTNLVYFRNPQATSIEDFDWSPVAHVENVHGRPDNWAD